MKSTITQEEAKDIATKIAVRLGLTEEDIAIFDDIAEFVNIKMDGDEDEGEN